MIIGPNGTGKSTVVCAICLGLGGRPELLGRAKQPTDFIRQDTSKATITIELQGRTRKSNVVIKRSIDTSGSTWQVNGMPSTHKEVKRITDDFKIMMDNLCQFLPQDKVSQFAKIPASELLRETERAVGSTNLIQYHDELIELDEKRSSIGSVLETEKVRLQELTEQQAGAEEMINLMKERQKYIDRCDLLNKAKVFLEYRDLALKKKEYEQGRKDAQAKLERLENHRAEFVALADSSKIKYGEASREAHKIQQDFNAKTLEVSRSKAKARSALEELQKDKSRLNSTENRRRTDKKNQEELIAKIKKMEEIKERQPAFDPQELVRNKELYRQIVSQMEAAQEDADVPKQELQVLEDDRSALSGNMRILREKLNRLNSVLSQKLDNLERNESRLGGDTARAADYVLKHKHLFDNEIHLPPVISVKIKDQRCLSQISGALSRNIMFTFTCESRKDYDTFTRIIIDENHWNVNVAEFSRSNKTRVEDHAEPCDRQILPSYGVNGFIIDLLDGSATVLNMLCHKANIHAVPYAVDVIKGQQKQSLMNAQNSYGEPLFRKFVDSKTLGAIVKSRYGARIVSCRESMVKSPPQYMRSSQGPSEEAIALVNSRMKEIEIAMKDCDQKRSDVRAKYDKLNAKLEELREEKKRAVEERNALRQTEQMAQQLTVKLNLLREQLKKFLHTDEYFDKAVAEIERNIQDHLKDMALASKKLVKYAKELVDLQRDFQRGKLKSMTYENEANIYNNLGGAGIEQAQRDLESAENQITSIKAEMQKLKSVVKRIRKDCTDEERAQIEEMYGDVDCTHDSLMQEIARMEAEIVSIRTGDEEVTLVKFKKRAQEIERLSQRVLSEGAASEEYTAKITHLRQLWEPELLSIVARVSHEFSNAFKLIKCVGEVRLGNTDKGFKDWTMDIVVSFRDGAPPQTLDHQRQSGGERSVSTIFYLISLQGLTKSPFRVVDEINQGMDQKNERIVHSRIVDVACQNNSSQYFLITPKLLTDLEYHEKMKVHSIYSGNFVKDMQGVTFSPCNLKNLVQIARKLAQEATDD